MGHRVAPVPLADAHEEQIFGGKAVSLGAALRHGLPVPPGVALSAALVDAVADGHAAAVDSVLGCRHLTDGPFAVRSSAVGEDSGGASFAGQHVTRLNVTRAGIAEAVRDVWQSGRSAAALAYRAKRGLEAMPMVGVVIQHLIEPRAAGVLFTRNPMTGADEFVIEAGWGLGEAVVSGRIVPDHYRLDADGRVIEQVPGDKDVRIVRRPDGDTVEEPVEPTLRRAHCLTPSHLERLHALAQRCRAVWAHHLDLEFAVAADDRVYLLQSRPITAAGPQSA